MTDSPRDRGTDPRTRTDAETDAGTGADARASAAPGAAPSRRALLGWGGAGLALGAAVTGG
nr:hypothetical protein [Streptomyces sp. MH191]